MTVNNILCIESSSQICSVAISGNQEVFFIESETAQNHAESLVSLIQDCLTLAKLTIKDMHAVAISSGPGSYTGLRIGTSTAKGIFALGFQETSDPKESEIMEYTYTHMRHESLPSRASMVRIRRSIQQQRRRTYSPSNIEQG